MTETLAFLDYSNEFFDTPREAKYPNTRKRSVKKKEKKQRASLENHQQPRNTSLSLREIAPKTDNQSKVFHSYLSGQNVVLHGCPGTGKTFLSFYLALKDVMDPEELATKVIIVRSAVQARNQGFMPGDQKQKQAVFEAPYHSICSELFGRSDAYELLKNKGVVEFVTTSFLRGETFRNAVVILDEFQNLDFGELSTVLSRVGENCRILLCGDTAQDDLTSERYKEKSGIQDIMRVCREMKSFDVVNFTTEDILRSDFVKQFILAKVKLGLL